MPDFSDPLSLPTLSLPASHFRNSRDQPPDDAILDDDWDRLSDSDLQHEAPPPGPARDPTMFAALPTPPSSPASTPS